MTKKYIPFYRLYTPEQEQFKLAPLTQEHTNAFAKTFCHLDTFATFTFTNGASISEENAKVLLKRFLNEADKIYFGNSVARKNIRLEREVFIHRTRDGGRFIHFHIWFNALGNKELFRETLKELWHKTLYNAGEVVIQNWTGEQFYGWREDWSNLGFDCWVQDLGHLDDKTHLYQAQLRQLSQATLNRLYKLHITQAQEISVKELIQANKTKRTKHQSQKDWDKHISKTKQYMLS